MSQDRILIVDDEASVVEACAEILEDAGYAVRQAFGGGKALTLLEEGPFDLLLVDLKMPYVDGLTVLRRARELNPDVAAVVITSYGTIENAVEALRAGARDFLLKPFEPDELVQAVGEALAAQRQEQEVLLLRAQLPILETSQALIAEANVESLAGRLVEFVAQQIGAERAWLLMLDEESGQLRVATCVGLSDEAVKGTAVSAVEGIGPQALASEEPLVLAAQSKTMQNAAWRVLGLRPDSATVFVRLRTAKKTIGLLTLNRTKPAGFSPAALTLLSILAAQMATALENAGLYESVQRELDERVRAEESLRRLLDETDRLLAEVHAQREQMQQLTHRLVSAQEEERHRLSRELHDDAGQALTALKIGLELIHADLPAEFRPLRQRLSKAIGMTDATMERIRLLAHDLRPPALDSLGLAPTLESFCRDYDERTHLSVDFAGGVVPTLPDEVGIGLYRFLQEAVTNVAKHAQANKVCVTLKCDDKGVSLSVEDDGQGFDEPSVLSEGIGLLGIQERLALLGGWLEIEPNSDQGTRLVAHVPWKEGLPT